MRLVPMTTLVFLFASAAVGCKGAGAATPPPPDANEVRVPVRLAAVAAGPVDRPIRGTGILRLKREMDLSFKVGGVVANVFVEEGARVKKGQVLARLDPTEVDAAVRQAKEGATKAERDRDRVQRLHTSGALPLADLQNAETGLALARAAVDAASFNLQRSAVIAPDDGRIDKRLVETGEIAAPGRPVFHMSGQSKGAIVRIGVTDRDILRVREGAVARVVLDARPETPLTGHVAQVATVASPGVGTFDVEVRLDDPPTDVLSGLTAKVAIEKREDVAAIVPIGSLAFSADRKAAVFVVDAGHAKRIPVTLAFLDGERAAIAAGDHALDGHPAIIEAGASQLEDGTRVKVVDPSPASAAVAPATTTPAGDAR